MVKQIYTAAVHCSGGPMENFGIFFIRVSFAFSGNEITAGAHANYPYFYESCTVIGWSLQLLQTLYNVNRNIMIHIFLHNKAEWHIRFAGSPDKVWGIYLGLYTTGLSAEYLNDYWHHYHSCIHKMFRGLPVTFYKVRSCSFFVWKKI